MSKIHHLLSIDPDKAITSNSRPSIKMLVNAISIVLISCIAVPTTIAQPTPLL
jgi:starvation-inducible outer membrane lipoprotein